MKILLLGEYSRLHNSLKKGLVELGHDVTIAGNGDGFKKYPVDLKLDHSFRSGFLKKLKVGIHKLSSIDIGSIEVYLKTKWHLHKLSGYDVVQLINESSLQIDPKLESILIKKIAAKNKKLFLLSAGIDHNNMMFMMEDSLKYSIMTPYLENTELKSDYQFQLQYLNNDFNKLHKIIIDKAEGIIASDLDYHLPLLRHPKYLGMIPNPIDVSSLQYLPLSVDGKIKIFHGVNAQAYIKKGNTFFDQALDIIQKKFPEKVSISRTTSLPYDEYIKTYNDCHILLDQVYAYDQGYNALEAMAKGKVVFTGAEREWLEFYNLKEDTVAINALPNAEAIAAKLEWLILNPYQILEISKNARAFIEREHDHLESAKQYLKAWTS